MSTAQRSLGFFSTFLLFTTAVATINNTISLSAVQSLNSSLNGRLRSSTPFSLPCFTRLSAANGSISRLASNSKACSSVINNYFDTSESQNRCRPVECLPVVADVRTDTFGAYKNVHNSSFGHIVLHEN